MQKKLLFVAFLLLAIFNNIVAEDTAGGQLTISDFSLYSGVNKEVSVELTNTDTYVGFQFDLYLPAGITVESFAGTSRLPEGTTPQMSVQSDGSYRFIAAALSGNAITDNSGAVMTLTLKAAESVTAGSYLGYLRNIKVSKADGSGVVAGEQPFGITVKDPVAYFVMSEGNTVLSLYYDKQMEERDGQPISSAVMTDSPTAVVNWSGHMSTITSVVIDSSFDDYLYVSNTRSWFQNCVNLTSITGLQYLHTDNVSDMMYMFYGCAKLTNLDLAGFNTSNVTSMQGMFAGCTGLTSLNLGSFNTAKVDDMSYMFYGDTGLKDITFGDNFSTASVVNMYGMFAQCTGLTTIDLSKFSTASANYLSYMFAYCSGLTTIDVSHFDTSKATDISGMFGYCSSLTSIDVSSFNTTNVTAMSGLFTNCNALTTLDVSSFNTAKVTTMGGSAADDGMFSQCANLTTIYAGSGWNTEAVAEGRNMFTGSTKLVGGAGTVYDASHTDHLYARIDGGTASPGYLTPGSGYGKVATPTFSWSGDSLTISSSTPDAEVWYTLSAAGSTTIPDTLLYTAPLYVVTDVRITATAKKLNWTNSDEAVLDYPGATWQQLKTAIDSALVAVAEGEGNERVNPGQIAELQTIISSAQNMYSERVASVDAINGMINDLKTATDNIMELVNAVDEAYALLDGTTLTFYYNKNKKVHDGMAVGPFTSAAQRPWHASRSSITTVTFDASFAAAAPTSTAYWFSDFGALTTLNGLDNLKTAEVTNMDGMFTNCSSLKTVYINSDWDLSKVSSSISMFNNCTDLLGGQWTEYLSSRTTAQYARIDGGTAAPGYFTSFADTIAPAAVTFSRDMYQLTLACATPHVRIMYTVMTGPATAVAYKTYTGPITLDGDCTVIAYAERPSGIRSASVNYPFSMSDVATVATPTYAWTGDQLALSCSTEGVTIYYTNSAEATTTPTVYTAPVTITTDAVLTAWAEKDGMNNSDTLVIDYPYTAWKNLTTAIATAQTTAAEAATSDRVTTEQRNSLNALITAAQHLYDERTAVADTITARTAELNNATAVIRALLDAVEEPYVVLDGTTLTFYYDTKKAERGGMDINNESVTSSPYGTATTAVFDASFADYRPTSTAYWFDSCSSLTSITGMENLKTDSVTNMRRMFYGCSKLTSLDVSGFNTSKVTNMDVMFMNCSGLTSLDVSGFKTDNVTSMWNMFYVCRNLTSLDVSNFNTANVTNMNGMFAGCSGLTSLDVSGFNTASVTDMGGMFQSCSGLTNLDVSAFKTANVTYMGGMFFHCSSLKTIYAGSEWSTAAVTDGANMFDSCTNLVGGMGTVYDTDHVDAEYARIDGGAAAPGYLTSIADTIAPATVTFSRDMYQLTMACETPGTAIWYAVTTAESRAATDPGIPTWTKYTAPLTLTSDCTVKAYAERPSGIRSAETQYTFKMSDVMKVETPTLAWSGDTLTVSTATEGAQIVSRLYLPGETTHAEETGGTTPIKFRVEVDCNLEIYAYKEGMLTSDTLRFYYPHDAWVSLTDAIATAQATAAEAATSDRVTAEQRNSLNALITTAQLLYDERTAVADTITAKTTELNNATEAIRALLDAVEEAYAVLEGTTVTFYYDTKKAERGGMEINHTSSDAAYASATLATFDASFVNYTTLTETAMWFYNCVNLKQITGMEYLNTSKVTDMQGMFSGCSSLESIDLSHFSTESATNIGNLFGGCRSLTSIDVSGFKTDKVQYMFSVFVECSGLTSIDVSNFNTENVTTLSNMFDRCTGLTTLDLSNFNTANVDDMYCMFRGSTNLKTIYVGKDWTNEKVSGSVGTLFTFGECYALVGGAGTTYDADHTNYEYARIDGGAAAPGYLTSIADTIAPATVTFNRDMYELTMACETPGASIQYAVVPEGSTATPTWLRYTGVVKLTEDCTVKAYAERPSGIRSAETEYVFKMSDVSTVDMPTFAWAGDTLTISCPTEGATIYYTNSAAAAGETVYTEPIVITADAVLTAWAAKAGLNNSDTLVIDYPYTAWHALTDAIATAQTTATEAATSDRVTAEQLAELNTLITVAEHLYAERIAVADTITVRTAELNNATAAIRALLDAVEEPYAVLDGTTLTFFYDTKKAERGGMDINTSYIEPGSKSPYETATTAVFDTSFAGYKPTSTSAWFMGCSSLNSIAGMENLKTDSVTHMSWMFYRCSSLTSLDLSGFNTANVRYMFDMFNGCSSLTSLDVSSFNTANVADMASMFVGCSGLTGLDVSGFNTVNVTKMDDMFGWCSGLTSLDLSGFNTSHVTNMDFMFRGCSDLTTIYAGSEWSTLALMSGENMFNGCSNLAGGMGTVYDADHVDAEYARIDGGAAAPGYLTSIADTTAPAVVTFSRTGHTVTLSCATPGVTIHYAIQPAGSTDVGTWMTYTDPLTLTEDCTIHAYAERPSGLRSDTTTYDFVLGAEFVTAPTIARVEGENRVEITNTSGTGVVYYNTDKDGLLTVDSAEPYTGAIDVTENMRINAAVVIDGIVSSDITSFMVDWFQVATPTYTWSADTLTVTTTTEDAVIQYRLLLAGTDTTADEGAEASPLKITVTQDVQVVLYAEKSGWTNSDTLTFNYPYTAWAALLDARAHGESVIDEVGGSDKVDPAMIDELNGLIKDAYDMYLLRAAGRAEVEDETARIEDLIHTILEMAYAEDEFTFDSHGVLHVYGSGKLEDALAAFGGRETVAKTLTAIVWDKTETLTDDMLEGLTDNPNLLVYVESVELAPVTVHNVVVGDRADDILLVDTETGNNDFYCPRTFTADRISYTRNFTQETQVGETRGWETLVLPFTVQTVTHESHGLLAPFGSTASTSHFWLRQLAADGLERATQIEAYRPYLISMPNDPVNYAEASCQNGRVTFSAIGATVAVGTPTPTALSDDSRRLIGTTVRVAQSPTVYALNVGKPDGTYLEGSVFVSDSRDVRPFECYTLHSDTGGSRYIGFNELREGDSMGIHDLLYDDMAQEQWYTTNGMKLQKRPTTKGVYILNGRKVVVK